MVEVTTPLIILESERIARGWSKSSLARRAGLNQTTVNLICNGRLKPGARHLQDLANALGYKGAPSELVEEAEDADD